MSCVLRFAPLESCIDVSFWSELGERKLDAFQLSEAKVAICGYLSPSRYVEVPSQLLIDGSSFGESTTRQGSHKVPGWLISFNTLASFKEQAKADMLQQAGKWVWDDICSGSAEADPSRLSRFLLLTYGDLKQFHFHYWFAFPALKPPAAFTTAQPTNTLATALGSQAAADVVAACNAWREGHVHAAASHAAAATAASATVITSSICDTAVGGDNPQADELPQPSGKAAPEVGRPSRSSPSPYWLLAAADATLRGAVAHPLSSYRSLLGGLPRPDDGSADDRSRDGGASGRADCHVALAFSDPCNLSEYPGWPLRNLLLLTAVRWGLKQVQVVCVRESRGGTDPARSLLLHVNLPPIPAGWPAPITPAAEIAPGGAAAAAVAAAAAAAAAPPPPPTATATWARGATGAAAAAVAAPEAVGWEANVQGKLSARFLDLSPLMSPLSLAEQAVDLNLRLMRWRAAPSLRIERMAQAKCLLLGAGTLGCAVARTLLAWGVRHITFVDSSTVSYSNPVRQSLYVFDDCMEGGRPKAVTAAESLAKIFPSVHSKGHALTIPMPGHPPANAAQAEQMRQDAEALDRLVAGHDAVFLLTDTRESRWLPALLAATYGKIAITSAIGFDSFVVMRHGAPPLPLLNATAPAAATAAGDTRMALPSGPPPPELLPKASNRGVGSDPVAARGGPVARASPAEGQPQGHQRLGCYFCNDVVAPLNSTVGRTLDQQCTVARPGLAPIAGAVAVELLAALLQHPCGVAAPPPSRQGGTNGGAAQSEQPALGAVPHMVRGQLSGFSQVCMEAQAFSQCTACSETVVRQYRRDGWAFLQLAIEDPGSLEKLTGLAELHQDADLLCGTDSDKDDAGPDGADSSTAVTVTARSAGNTAVEEDWTEL